MWDFLNVLKQTFLKRYVAVVVSLGIGGLLAWSVPHGRKPEPVAKSVTESTTDAATAPLHHEIALLGERIVTLEHDLAQAQTANEQCAAVKQEATVKPMKPARHRKVAKLHHLKIAAKPTKPSRLAHVSARGAIHPTDIAGPLIPAGAVTDNSPGT